jgi:hypothetical protein
MKLDLTPNLTAVFSRELTGQIRGSHVGMAHFAGTGPAGTTCGGCVFLDDKLAGKPGREHRIQQPGCRKYLRLTGRHGGAIPDNTPACKYFEGK